MVVRRATWWSPATAGARAHMYELLAHAYIYPSRQFFHQLRTREWFDQLRQATSQLPYRLPIRKGFRATTSLARLQEGYVGLFDVGPKGPPFPLYSGHHFRDRMQVMEELVRFYSFFGLRLAPGHMPDHLTILLEFMGRLAASELHPQTEIGSYWRAQRDFLERHLLSWVPRLAQQVAQHKAPLFYKALCLFTWRFLDADYRYLCQLLNTEGGEI